MLAFTLGGLGSNADLHVILNMESADLDFDVPRLQGRSWYRVVDTSLASPNDVVDDTAAALVDSSTYHAGTRSVVVLVSR